MAGRARAEVVQTAAMWVMGRRRRAVWLALGVWVALVLYGTLNPVTEPRPALFPHADKFLHFGAWAGIGFLAGLLVRTRRELVAVFLAAAERFRTAGSP